MKSYLIIIYFIGLSCIYYLMDNIYSDKINIFINIIFYLLFFIFIRLKKSTKKIFFCYNSFYIFLCLQQIFLTISGIKSSPGESGFGIFILVFCILFLLVIITIIKKVFKKK